MSSASISLISAVLKCGVGHIHDLGGVSFIGCLPVSIQGSSMKVAASCGYLPSLWFLRIKTPIDRKSSAEQFVAYFSD